MHNAEYKNEAAGFGSLIFSLSKNRVIARGAITLAWQSCEEDRGRFCFLALRFIM